MFSKLALFAVASMAVFVAAAPAPQDGGDNSDGGINNSCNTGPVQCCNQLVDPSTAQDNKLIALLGLVLGPIQGNVGVSCSPITLIGTGNGASCSSQPVCCNDNSFNGLVAIGCSPINVNA